MLAHAVDLARACGARLTVAHVCEPVDEPFDELHDWLLPGRADVDAQLALERLARSVADDLDVTVHVLTGRVASELGALTRWLWPDVLVVGRWRTSLASAVPCPVLVVGARRVPDLHQERAGPALRGGPAALV